MIILYGFGPAFGLPDPSPYVVKTMIHLTMAGLAFRLVPGSPMKAPRGKIPYIDDGGTIVSDSHLIRRYIAEKYQYDFESGLSAEQAATGWAAERLCEDHLYWGLVAERWLDDANFYKGPAVFFNSLPAPLRPLVRALIRRKVRQNLHAHGMGRFSLEERNTLISEDLQALSALIGDKPFLLGDQPSGADATVFAFVDGVLCDHFTSHGRNATSRLTNLVAYRDRMAACFPLPR